MAITVVFTACLNRNTADNSNYRNLLITPYNRRMNDSPSDYIDLPIKASKGEHKSLRKDYEAHGLLVRNELYMSRIKQIREQYHVGDYTPEDDSSETLEQYLPSEEQRQAFDKDIRELADNIRYPGDWFEGVRKHVLGLEPEQYLRSKSDKKVLAKLHGNNLELRLYGDLTQTELRSVLGQARKQLAKINGKSDTKTKAKYRLNKNLAIYDMWQSGKSYSFIAKYCKDIGLQTGLTPEDVSKNIQLTKNI